MLSDVIAGRQFFPAPVGWQGEKTQREFSARAPPPTSLMVRPLIMCLFNVCFRLRTFC